jgi:hypothetical protein
LWIAIALAITLSAPSLFAELYCDDQFAVLELEGTLPASQPGPLNLYTFASGAADQHALVIDDGPLPWFTSPDLRLKFFRPLSSGFLALEHAIAGRAPLVYHLGALAWYLAALVAASRLLRRLWPEREAAAATLLFAIAPSHWMLAAWPSASHVAISGAPAIVALLLHLRARERDDVRAPVAAGSIACAAIALAAGETALGVFAYVGAYELLGRTDAWSRRARALAPWALVFTAYAIAYKALGYGAHGSGEYIDPIEDPRVYFSELPARLGVLANAALLGVPSELSVLVPAARPAIATAGALAVLAFAFVVRRTLRRLTPADARTMRWLLAGAALAAIPGTAGILGDRVLFLPSVGVISAIVLVLLRGGRAKEESFLHALFPRVAMIVLALVHLVLATPVWLAGVMQLLSTSKASLAVARSAEIPKREGVNVIGVGLSDPMTGMYIASALCLTRDRTELPASVRVLSGSARDHRVRRADDRTLEIEIVGGSILEGAFERVVRSPRDPLRAGDVVKLDGASVRVLADDDGKPTRFAATFDRSLEDPSFAFVIWKDGALRALLLPKIGDEVFVRHEPGPMGM